MCKGPPAWRNLESAEFPFEAEVSAMCPADAHRMNGMIEALVPKFALGPIIS